MTRVGFFLFNTLFVFFIYGLVFVSSSKSAAISYLLTNISLPYMLIILIMLIISTIRWFMSHETEIAREAVTWANLLWVVPLLTVIALYAVGGIDGHSIQSFRSLFAAR